MKLGAMNPSAMAAALGLGLLIALTPLAAAAGKPEIKEVTVLQRIWHVSLSQDHPGYYKATRRNDEMLPFRGPAVLSARQAARAFRAATGCRAKADTMFRTISGNYYAKLICPSR